MSILDLRPENFKKAFPDSRVMHVNGKSILQSAMKEGSHWVVMAVNTRHEIAMPGMIKASMELNAPVIYELALSESDLSGGYTGLTPKDFITLVVTLNEKMGNVGEKAVPFACHRDHTTVQEVSRKAFDKADALIKASIEAGYGSFSIDVSFLPMDQNIALSALLSEQVIRAGLMYESEVGEIGGAHGNSSVSEAVTLVEALAKLGQCPDLIAINNGTTHGNVRGNIDLELTYNTYKAMSPWGVGIAQHGTTGTAIEDVGKFYKYGIFKANVGTTWQNVIWGIDTDEYGVAVEKGPSYQKNPDKGISMDLWKKMEEYALSNNMKGGNMKKLFKPFKDAMAQEYYSNKKIQERIDQSVYETAAAYFKALQAVGKSDDVKAQMEKTVSKQSVKESKERDYE